jgi:hypothetical protein
MEPGVRDLDPLLRAIAPFVGSRITPRFEKAGTGDNAAIYVRKDEPSHLAQEEIAVRQHTKHNIAPLPQSHHP